MENIWGYVLSATVYGSITGIVILLIKSLLKNRINKKYAYLLWMVLIIKLAFPLGPESNLSLFNKIPVKINNQSSIHIINRQNTSENINYTVDENYGSSSNETLEAEETTVSQESSVVQSIEGKSIYINIVPMIWISGVILALTAHIIIYMHFIKNLRKKENYKYDHLECVLKECKEKLHIKRKVNIVVDNMINSPSLVGIFKTRIIIPSSLIDLSEEELQHIFLHELCHFKSKDNWVDHALVLLQCVHWFNPLVCYLFKHVRNDMEMACDERVLSLLNEKDHNKYGITMLTVLEKVNFNKRFAVGLNMADDKKTIKKRVELIKNSKYFTKKKKMLTLVGIICLIGVGSILLTNGKPDSKDNSKLFNSNLYDDDLNKAISEVIIDKYLYVNDGKEILGGEFAAEGHDIIGKKEDENFIEVYLMSTYGVYEFQNDIFNMTIGMSNIPMKIKLSKNKEGQILDNNSKYYYLDSKVAEDGDSFENSVYELLPKKEAIQALYYSDDNNYSKELLKEMNEQAESYVNSINRRCEVTSEYVEKEYIDELALVDRADMEELWYYPEWIGTREELEDGKRYIYETQYDKSSSTVTFTKYNENKDQLENIQYKINGKNLEQIDSEKFISYDDDTAPVFIDNEDFKMIVKNILISDNNAEYGVYIENKTNENMEISLDEIHIGESSKSVEFQVELNGKEGKNANLKIKNISKLNDLYDKIYGEFLGNSSKYDFIFK